MQHITVDFSKNNGVIKPMHAVNNGPAGSRTRGIKGNIDLYQAAGIPFARNHDASFSSGYGGEHTVDVHRIFKRFEADENDPASYQFESTDRYVQDTLSAGTQVFTAWAPPLNTDKSRVPIPPPILQNGRGSVSISSGITTKGGQTASTTTSPIGRSGMSRIVGMPTEVIPAGKAPWNRFWICSPLPWNI